MRVLLIGGGARGRALTRRLVADGDAVRAVSRDAHTREELTRLGAEALDGDPDRIGTLRYACANVTVLVWALGTAHGDDEEKVQALHGSRLEMMLMRTIDTTVRAVVYEGSGSLPLETLEAGSAVVTRLCRKNEIPFALLEADGRDEEAWADAAFRAIHTLLDQPRG
jgi:hypothetical protein